MICYIVTVHGKINMLKMPYIAGILIALVAAASLPTGCRPSGESGEEMMPQPIGFDLPGAGSAPVHDVRAMSDLALQIVREAPAEEGGGATTGGQIEEQTAALEGSVMFPRWTARRVGANDYEVRFTFTHIDNQYNMNKTGFSWIVNVAQKTAGPRRVLRPEDFDEAGGAMRTPCDWEPLMFRESSAHEKQ